MLFCVQISIYKQSFWVKMLGNKSVCLCWISMAFCVLHMFSLQPHVSSTVWTRLLSIHRRNHFYFVAHPLGLQNAVAVVKAQHICPKQSKCKDADSISLQWALRVMCYFCVTHRLQVRGRWGSCPLGPGEHCSVHWARPGASLQLFDSPPFWFAYRHQNLYLLHHWQTATWVGKRITNSKAQHIIFV